MAAAKIIRIIVNLPGPSLVITPRGPTASASDEQLADYARANIRQVRQLLLRNDETRRIYVNPTFSWVRLAQRIPVRIAIDKPMGSLVLVSGRTATVQIEAKPQQSRRAWFPK